MIELRLPWPAKELWSNARPHWARKSKQTTIARATAAYTLKTSSWERFSALCANGPAIRIHLQFCPPDKRKRDEQNMEFACKAYIDGIQDALGIDDSNFKITRSTSHLPDFAGVKVRIEAAE